MSKYICHNICFEMTWWASLSVKDLANAFLEGHLLVIGLRLFTIPNATIDDGIKGPFASLKCGDGGQSGSRSLSGHVHHSAPSEGLQVGRD